MAQAVNRRLLIAEVCVRSQASPGWSCGRQMALGQVFLPELSFSFVSTIASVFRTHSFIVHRL
jgi:hypothetical protein